MTPYTHPSQRGAALVIALLLLLVMTIIGITSIQSSTVQTRMAANSDDRNRALQAAEHSLRAALNKLHDESGTGLGALETAFNGTTTPGLYTSLQEVNNTCTRLSPWQGGNVWSTANSLEAAGIKTTVVPNLQNDPRYMIALDNVFDPTSDCYFDSTMEGFAEGVGNAAPPIAALFTITALGNGAQPNTRARLQQRVAQAY